MEHCLKGVARPENEQTKKAISIEESSIVSDLIAAHNKLRSALESSREFESLLKSQRLINGDIPEPVDSFEPADIRALAIWINYFANELYASNSTIFNAVHKEFCMKG